MSEFVSLQLFRLDPATILDRISWLKDYSNPIYNEFWLEVDLITLAYFTLYWIRSIPRAGNFTFLIIFSEFLQKKSEFLFYNPENFKKCTKHFCWIFHKESTKLPKVCGKLTKTKSNQCCLYFSCMTLICLQTNKQNMNLMQGLNHCWSFKSSISTLNRTKRQVFFCFVCVCVFLLHVKCLYTETLFVLLWPVPTFIAPHLKGGVTS